ASKIVLFRLNPSTKLSSRPPPRFSPMTTTAPADIASTIRGQLQPRDLRRRDRDRAGACAVGKGCDSGRDSVKVSGGGSGGSEVEEVVVGEGGKLGEGEEECCVDEWQGLGIEEKR
ncbi:hypothetical protein PIB30_086447, partial [Stylosanthes scabra]|nr:hypothetical protein [Stylosanthes scabra]